MVKTEALNTLKGIRCVVLSRHFVAITFPSFSFFFFLSRSLCSPAPCQLPFHAADNRQLKLVSRPIPRLLLRFLGKLGVELVLAASSKKKKIKKKKVFESRLENVRRT